MENKNIIKLRNHHITKGKSTDRRPIYPITTAEAVEGLEDKIAEMGGGLKYAVTAPKFTHIDSTLGTPKLTAIAYSRILEPNVYYNLGDVFEDTMVDTGGAQTKGGGGDDTSDVSILAVDNKIRFFLKDYYKNPDFINGGEGYMQEYYIEFFYNQEAADIIISEATSEDSFVGTSPILTPIVLTSNYAPGHRLLMHIVGKDVFIYEVSSDFPGPDNFPGDRGTTR